MSHVQATAQQLLRSNRTLALFLAKMVAAYAVWFLVYDLWLLPDGTVDHWLSLRVASWTGGLLSVFSDGVVVNGRVVSLDNAAISIEDGCNGLSALSLFVGFVLAYPGTWARRALFIPAGLALIVLTNVIRCVSLLVITERLPAMYTAVHGFQALFVFYIVIFALWVAWTHVGEGPAATDGQRPVEASSLSAA